LEALRQFGLAGKVGKEYLHGLDPICDGVAHLKDLTHASFPKNADDLVIADNTARIEIHGGTPATAS
jgi:hypothetical protein